MIKEIIVSGRKIEYELTRKRVTNINLRIKPNGKVMVSAGYRVPEKFIEEFLISKADFISNALDKFERIQKEELVQYFSEEELRKCVLELCRQVYPYYEKRGISYPTVKFRKMTSRWGSCHPKKGILTFNTNLMYAPIECVEYVIFHEFTHFLVANHSPEFYCELEKVCSGWKARRKVLKEIILT